MIGINEERKENISEWERPASGRGICPKIKRTRLQNSSTNAKGHWRKF